MVVEDSRPISLEPLWNDCASDWKPGTAFGHAAGSNQNDDRAQTFFGQGNAFGGRGCGELRLFLPRETYSTTLASRSGSPI
jgi:hypothetical protein